MPPHLHRRPPLRQPMPARRRPLLLPPHHSQADSGPKVPQDTSLQLPAPTPRRPIRHPALHRPGPPKNRRQRNRSQKSRPAPLRPPDRQPQSSQTHQNTKHTIQRASPTPDRRRNHLRPRARHPRSTIRNHSTCRTQKRRHPPHRGDRARARGRGRGRKEAPGIDDPSTTHHALNHPGHRRRIRVIRANQRQAVLNA